MRIPQRIIDDISSRVSLVEVVSGYLTLERKGARYWGLCPFHQEKTPSFSVSPEENVYYCFGCQKGGNLFGFIEEVENLSFPETVRLLADRAGIEIPEEESPESSARSTLLELNSRVAGSFHYLLINSDAAKSAREYLAERGVSEASVEQFLLGYARGERKWLHQFLKKHHYSDEFLAASGLFSRKYPTSSFFSDRLMFPIRNGRGETVAFGGRVLEDREPKYINSPDTPVFSKRASLFGLHEALPAIRKQRSFVVAEGYLDVIALHQAGETRAVAPLGTAFTAEQLQVLRRYADTAILLFDGDAAGVRAAEKAVATCERSEIESEVVLLPDGRDPGDYLREGSLDVLVNVLKNRQKGFIFVLDQATRRYDIREPGGKETALRYLWPFVEAAHSEVRRQAFLDEIADALRVDPKAVRTDYSRQSRRDAVSSSTRSTPRAMSQDLFLMLAVALNRDEFGRVRAQISAEDLSDSRAKELYIALEECFREDEDSLDALLRRIFDDALKQLVLEKAVLEEFSLRGEKIIRDSVISIKERTLTQKRDRVTLDIRALEKGGVRTDEIRPLMEEIMWIDAELEKLKESRNE